MFSKTKDVLVILGATATGKSKLAIKIAKECNAIIISADAYQVYKGLDIGTAKVTKEKQQGISHYLIDIKTPDERYSAAEFVQRSQDIIKHARQLKKKSIVCGGTALYLHGFLYNYQFPEKHHEHEKITQLLNSLSEKHEQWAYLKKVDPEAAKNIHPNNHVRIRRALSVTLNTGVPFSKQAQKSSLRKDVAIMGISCLRDTLYQRINKRVDKMIQQGLIEEVYSLYKSGYNQKHQALQAIGYKETLAYITGSLTKEEMIERIKKNTRHFAKRQETWFKKFEQINWHEAPHS
ncbi:MAG: tRNA (adenosine(37)-N6)-dimethylallyltransferase MiaA [bacterium]